MSLQHMKSENSARENMTFKVQNRTISFYNKGQKQPEAVKINNPEQKLMTIVSNYYVPH